MFEGVIEDYVEADLGAEIHGSQICIRTHPGLRSSPDGYIVVSTFMKDGEKHILTTDMFNENVPDFIMKNIALLEFKCPMSRLPDGKIPKNYKPQLQLGLALAEVCDYAIFADALFRKCALADLTDNSNYDTNYHVSKDKIAFASADSPLPIATGIIGVYAPSTTAPIHIRMNWKTEEWYEDYPTVDYSQKGWMLSKQNIVSNANANANVNNANVNNANVNNANVNNISIADFGLADKTTFNEVLYYIDSGVFKTIKSKPYLMDGRFSKMPTSENVIRSFNNIEHYTLIGVIPWKLFSVDYIPVEREDGFLNKVKPFLDRFNDAMEKGEGTMLNMLYEGNTDSMKLKDEGDTKK
jgi:hypothetical protein